MGLKTEFIFTAQCDECMAQFTPAPSGNPNFSNVLDLRIALVRYCWKIMNNSFCVYCPDCKAKMNLDEEQE